MKNFIEIGKTEEEQAEQIKQWIKENSIQIIVIFAVGLSAIWGWDYYKNYQSQQSIKARLSYLSLVSDPSNTKALATLQKNHKDNGYTQQAGLVLAKHAFDAKKYQQALDYLAPLTNVENEFIAHPAKLRSASIYLQMANYKQALALLFEDKYSAFSGLYSNIKGDVYLAQGNIALAKEHYKLALEQLTNSELKQIVQTKLNDLN